MGPETTLRRNAASVGARVGSLTLLLDPASDEMVELNPVAAAIWARLDAPRSFASLADSLRSTFDVEASEYERDLAGIIEQLIGLGFVEMVHPSTGSRPMPIRPVRPNNVETHSLDDQPKSTPEFRLCLACCRWNFDEGNLDQVVALASAVSWPKFAKLTRYHRIRGLVWNCLSGCESLIPPSEALAMASDAMDIAATNLRAIAMSRELINEFDRRGLATPLFIKGLSTSTLAYSNPMAKMAWDIDLLIAPSELAEAAALLEARGYRLAVPSSRPALGKWHSREKESVWHKDRPDLPIELHTRLADHSRVIPTITVLSPRQEAEVLPGFSLPTLGDTELFAYLTVHGASSAWFRLKWISDLAGFLHRKTGPEIEALYDAALQLGAGRAPGQALLLADSLFGSLNDAPALRSRLQSTRTIRLLSEAALALVSGEPLEPTERLLGTWTIHWTQLLMLPGIRFASSEAWRQATKVMRGH